MLYRERVALCYEINIKHLNTVCGQNVEHLSIKPGGMHNNDRALKGQFAVLVCFLAISRSIHYAKGPKYNPGGSQLQTPGSAVTYDLVLDLLRSLQCVTVTTATHYHVNLKLIAFASVR
jgi:hypothetical protein